MAKYTYKYRKDYYLPNGKRKTIRSNDPEDFQRKVLKAEQELAAGVNIMDPTCVCDLIQQWFSLTKEPYLRDTSLNTLRGTINRYCLPKWFASKKVRDVKPVDIARLMSELNIYSQSTQSKVLQILRSAFQFAVDNDIILKSPVRGYHKSRGSAPDEVVPLTIEESNQLLEVTYGTRVYVPICLMLACGLRRGEVCGLMWSDVDFDSQVIHVRHTCILVRGLERVEERTKTRAGRRDIPMPDWLVSVLKSEKAKSNSIYVSPKPNGDHHTQGSWRHMWQLVTRREIRSATPNDKHTDCPRVLDFHCHPHQLRHTCITRWLEQGLDFKEIQYLAGHSTIDMTLSLYSHYGKRGRFEDTKSKLIQLDLYSNDAKDTSVSSL